MVTSLQKDINIALIGYGYWGKKIYQALQSISYVKQIFVVDLNIADKSIENHFLEDILRNKSISHVIIATPEITHYQIAKKCLEAGKNTFVEKPLCLHKAQAIELEAIAKKLKLKLVVDYIFLYDPYLQKLSQLIDQNIIGTLNFIQTERYSTHINKPNTTIFQDLAPHDIYIAQHFFNSNPQTTAATIEYIENGLANQGKIQLNFPTGTLVGHYSWIQPYSRRILTFIGSNGILIWDKNKPVIELYKNQNLTENFTINTISSPLEIILTQFISNSQSNRSYITDVETLEKLHQ